MLTPIGTSAVLPGKAQCQLAGAVVVEPHPVEQRAVVGQPEHPRWRIARLRLRGDGADLGVAESQRAPGLQARAVLVETGGQAQRAGEAHPEDGAGQHRIAAGPAICASPRRSGASAVTRPQQREHQGVDAFGGNQEERPPQRAVHHESRG